MPTPILANPTPAVKPLPKTAAERVRELASIHMAVCRHCKPGGTGMRCSAGVELEANATRLWLKAAEMAARTQAVEAARCGR